MLPNKEVYVVCECFSQCQDLPYIVSNAGIVRK
jgi:hypothetical protein